jgi:endonuclease-3
MNQKIIRIIFSRFRDAMAKPTTELIYHSHFELLIAVILSAQATDKSVNKVTPALFAVANTPEKIFQLGEEKLKEYVKSINLYKTKSANIIKTCKILMDKHHSHVPQTREALEELSGVGRKTANVILNTCFNQPTIAVDTHIFRVANRIGLTHGKTPLQVENQLLKVIPTEFLHDAHHWLILHGRYTCTARKPHCSTCLINDYCEHPVFVQN